jgi:hypothetical protein
MSRSERETERPTARLLAKCRHRVSAKPTSACGYLVSERLKADGGRMALLPKAGIGKFLALKSRWNCARLFISARPLSSARKGDFAHCSVARGARSVPPVSDAPSPPVPFFLTPPEGAGGTPSYRRWAYGEASGSNQTLGTRQAMSQKGALRPYRGRREGQKSGPKRANAGRDSSASALAISGISGVGENPCNADARGGAVHRMVEFSEPESGWQTKPRISLLRYVHVSTAPGSPDYL